MRTRRVTHVPCAARTAASGPAVGRIRHSGFTCSVLGPLAVLLALGCRDPAPAARVELAAHLRSVGRGAPARAAAAVAGWRLDRASWDAVLVEPYRAAYADYARAFDAAAPALAAQLARGGPVTTRGHFTGDPRLTRGQARARWAVPVQFPSEVAELDGAALDVVFVRTRTGWGAITGIDALLEARIEAQQPGCAVHLARVRADACGEIVWMVADAALRADRPRLARACALAANVCR